MYKMAADAVSRNFFFSSRRRHTRWNCDWSSDVCSSDLEVFQLGLHAGYLLNGAEGRVERPVPGRPGSRDGALITDGNLGGARNTALCVDLHVAQRKASGCTPAECFLRGELQVFGVKRALALGQAEDQRVDRPELFFVQLDSHRGEFFGQAAPARRGAD